MIKKNGQVAFEFLITFIIIIVIISLAIAAIGKISIQISIDEKKAEVDDFANSILNEFDVMQKVHSGFNRSFVVPSHFMSRFNLNISDGYLIITDAYVYGNDSNDFMNYYLIPGEFNVSTIQDPISKNMTVTITRAYDQKFDGLTIIN